MFQVNIEGKNIIDYIAVPVLLIYGNKKSEALVGKEAGIEECERVVLKDNVKQWITDNIQGKYFVQDTYICFENEEEAIYFKTVWL